MRTDVRHRHPAVLVLRRQVDHAEAQGVGAVAVDDVKRIDAVALALAHSLAETVENLRVNVHVAERHLAHVVEAGQHHARHPERDDVAARHQHVGRIVVGQFRRFLRPAQRRMRPERGAEPGVEDVGVLLETIAFQFRREIVGLRTKTDNLACQTWHRLVDFILARHHFDSVLSPNGSVKETGSRFRQFVQVSIHLRFLVI